jgi:DNA-binding MarR family transcriptional regulator
MNATPAADQPDRREPQSADALDRVRLSAWRAVSSSRDVVYNELSARMRKAGLPLEWYEVLLHLRESDNGRLRQSELEGRATIGSTGVSRMLAKMEQAGLVSRTTTAEDRRALTVELTPLGSDTLLHVTPTYLKCVQQTFGRRLDDTEAATVVGLLSRVATTAPAPDVVESEHLVPFGETVLAVTEGAVAASDAIQIRNALEPLLLLDAARHLTPSAAGDMRAIIGRMSNLLDRPEDFFHTDWQLHRTIAQLCKNASLKQIYFRLLDTIEAHMEYVVPTANLEEYLNRRLIIHARLVDAVCSGDEERVRRAADEHHFPTAQPIRLTNL